MARRRLQDRLVAAIQKEGGLLRIGRIDTMAGGCLKVPHPILPGQFYFVGKSGSLRVGETRSKSRVVGHRRRFELLEKEPENA